MRFLRRGGRACRSLCWEVRQTESYTGPRSVCLATFRNRATTGTFSERVQMPLDEPDKYKNRCVRVGKYRVISHLATGGMGAVYKARDEELGRIVALKILIRDLAIRPERVDRFRKEARHAARLNHENIVRIYEFGEFEDLQYLALEYVDGVDLLHYIGERGRLEPEEACNILTQAATALEHSFEEGIIHRDVKPSNL